VCVCVCVFAVRSLSSACFLSGCRYLLRRQLFFPDQNSAGASVSEQYRRNVFLCFCLFMCCVCVCVCVCPRERAIKGAVWWRDCIKSVRDKKRSGRQLRGQHVGVDGGLMQVPNSTSALGFLYSIHLCLLYFCKRLLVDAVNPPGAITM